jgi:predicted GIY-YIG superfamily endonuclease
MKYRLACHHYVYVVLLDDSIKKLIAVRKLNPRRLSDKPCVYVGMTGLTPKERFENHKKGKKSGKGYVKKYGIKLLPELYEDRNPMTYDEAVIVEEALAKKLRREGYTVVGGH